MLAIFWRLLAKALYRIFALWSTFLVSVIVFCAIIVLPLFLYFSGDLPDYMQLMQYDPPTITRIYTYDGKLMSEIAKEKRIFRNISHIPDVVIKAFIAAEDQNYYTHPGIDMSSIFRAVFQNIVNIANDRNPVGGSTITQQVVKNFLLTNEKSISRKIKEAILAYRINKVYSKDRILELYLNQIYLGHGSYGVTSAALGYFNKDLKHILLHEAALLAALPKAPSHLDPAKDSQRVLPRRNWVIDRMLDEGFISKNQAEMAKKMPIKLDSRFETAVLENGYYTESTRLELIERYGYDNVYQDGLSVYTNINTELQKYADEALRSGLIEYDRRHGFTGPISNVKNDIGSWQSALKKISAPDAIGNWDMAVILDLEPDYAKIGLKNGSIGKILINNTKWARKRLKNSFLGKSVDSMRDIFAIGDVILVSKESDGVYNLEQIPAANGALVVIHPKTGRVLAMVGGYSFKQSKYNRVIQALRQPGSAFKTFVYLAALEKGYVPTSIVRDSPISIPQGPGKPDWTPKNYEGRVFLGPITMRKAFERSRNLATVHIITKIGARSVGEIAKRFGVYDKAPPNYYSMALGANETTLMKLTAAYSVFANDGAYVEPSLIDRVEDRRGSIIYSSDKSVCNGCGNDDVAPELMMERKYVVDSRTNFQMLSMLQGAVERGTAIRAKSLGRVIAGKTGTSNDANDTWFIGLLPDMAVGVYIGYDAPQTLGSKEQGSSVALPVFMKFISKALGKIPSKEFSIPDGIEFISCDYNTGKPAIFTRNAVMEPVKIGAPEDAPDISVENEVGIFELTEEEE